MSPSEPATVVRRQLLKSAIFRRFGRNDGGSAAVEFAIVAIPFFMFIFCLVGCSLYFFMVSSLERGMDQASRLIRTGQAVTNKMTVDDFRQTICSGAGQWINCKKVEVWVQPYDDWSKITSGTNIDGSGVHSCLGANEVVLNNSANYGKLIAVQAGTASTVVIVTVCYPWDFASKIPFINLQNMQNGSMMMQTSTAFRSEPYPGAKS
jgi:hypothetical protein